MALQVEGARRADVTQDEGSYSTFLDQDDWYAEQLTRERVKLLAEDEAKKAGIAQDLARKEAGEKERAEEARRAAVARYEQTLVCHSNK